ncbi:MAG: glycerol-3-phosphate dehydrogenase, partial [Herbaspirillum sp.]
TKCISARREGDTWHAVLEHQHASGVQQEEVRARAIVNAAGPWAARFAQSVPQAKTGRSLRLIKGSHIVVKRLFDHPYAYIFQNPDKRIIFAIPYQEEFTLIGTTDLEYHGDAGKVEIDAEEIDYLCEMANRYFKRQIGKEDVVWTYSGVRPLLDDSAENASAITRDYLLECDDAGAPMLNVWGGKITTYRKLAEEALSMLAPHLGASSQPWTAGAPLPGGDLEQPGKMVARYDFDAYLRKLQARTPWLPAGLAHRYARSYGSRVDQIIGQADSLAALGEELTPGLYEAEARYLVQHEWARGADDILWRRSKLGLHCGPQHRGRLEAWLANLPDAAPH